MQRSPRTLEPIATPRSPRRQDLVPQLGVQPSWAPTGADACLAEGSRWRESCDPHRAIFMHDVLLPGQAGWVPPGCLWQPSQWQPVPPPPSHDSQVMRKFLAAAAVSDPSVEHATTRNMLQPDANRVYSKLPILTPRARIPTDGRHELRPTGDASCFAVAIPRTPGSSAAASPRQLLLKREARVAEYMARRDKLLRYQDETDEQRRTVRPVATPPSSPRIEV